MSGFVCVNCRDGHWACSGELLDEVDERKDRDPDDVDEVPVQRRDVDEQRVLGSEPALDVDREQREQPEHAGRHVRAVEAR